jgi:hypothetical protein
MSSRAGEEFFGNRHRAITCQADLGVFPEGGRTGVRNRDGRPSELTFAGEHLGA